MYTDPAHPIALRTPLVPSFPMSSPQGPRIWLKLEALQPSGSFKLRGMARKAVRAKAQGATLFVSSSGGNAGLAVAFAGQQLGVAVSVFVPETTPAATVARLRGYGAEVTVTGQFWHDAHAKAQVAADQPGAVMFHPFDDPEIWPGYGDILAETLADGVTPDLVICSVGGGGLMSGLLEGLARTGLQDVPLLAVETVGADALHQSRLAGEQITLPSITSRAKSLAAPRVCDQAYRALSEHPVFTATVTDEQAENACQRFLDEHRLKVEMACGAALAAVYDQAHEQIAASKDILVVLCGGVND